MSAPCAVIFLWIVWKTSTIFHNKRALYKKWIEARRKRIVWFRSHPYHVPYSDLVKTPVGQWFLRTEAGAHEILLLNKLLLSGNDIKTRGWYERHIFPEIKVEEPIEQ